MEKLAERRIAEYRTLIDDFQTEIRNINPKGIQEPHIPVFGDYYEKCNTKISHFFYQVFFKISKL